MEMKSLKKWEKNSLRKCGEKKYKVVRRGGVKGSKERSSIRELYICLSHVFLVKS